MKDNILGQLDKIEQLQQGDMCTPVFADLHLTNRCNQKCIGCAYADKIDGDVMSLHHARKIIFDLYNLGVKTFDFAGGGEPLLLSGIEHIFDLVIKLGCNYGLITNGVQLSVRNLYAQLVEQATYVRVSLEASDAVSYQTYKRSGEFNHVIDNIRKMVQYKKEIGSPCEIGLKFAVSKTLRGLDHYYNALKLADELGVDNVQFKTLRHEPEELSIEEKWYENITLANICMSVNSNKPPKQNPVVSWWIEPVPDEEVPQCWLNPLHVVVDHIGNVYLCCYYYYREKKHCLGNMLELPIRILWYNREHTQLIKEIDRNECKKVDCKFFRHHNTIKQFLSPRGANYFL